MIFDCFIFYNEIKMLKFRLAELFDFVDYFIIIEANETFSGIKKQNYFSQIKDLDKYSKKIIYKSISFPSGLYLWDKEIYQRNHIRNVLETLNPKDEDLVIISDVDEIPDVKNLQIGLMDQDLYYYNLEYKIHSYWKGSAMTTYANLKNYESIQKFRIYNNLNVYKAGWHFSYFGDENFISNKIKSFSHQELNIEKYTDKILIKQSIDNSENIFDKQKIIKIPIKENNYLPINYQMLL
jgi:beta-1,4-mannosyl-glycoprotein beta-1,4-N-acetylglucosaminyltransferase